MKQQITVTVNGSTLTAAAGLTLSEIIGGEKPCGGHGRCGKCKVMARGELSGVTDAENRVLTADELKKGYRLACAARALGDCTVTVTADGQAQILRAGAMPAFRPAPSFRHCGAAIDIGTTTLAARLYDPDGALLSETSRLNPQTAWGADVISRIEASLGGSAEALAGAIRKALNEMLSELARSARMEETEIDGAVITGNTVMLTLLTGESAEPFSHAPFAAERLYGETLTAKELELTVLSPETAIYLPPCISAFVGADTVCAILAAGLTEKKGPAMLVDIGTNGETALWNNGKLTVCSTAAGPAFEGVGISMGMRGAVGAIDRVTLQNGKVQVRVIGGTEPKGICGSGLIDAVACMLDAEILDETGYLEDGAFEVKPPVRLTQKDIRMLQLAKSAICAGILTVLSRENLSPSEVERLYVAGGFGVNLDMGSAVKIGLLPEVLAKHAESVGNAALAGASAVLLNRHAVSALQRIAAGGKVLELSVDPLFSDLYLSGMTFEEAGK